MATHRYILSMGHRNTDRGGAAGEFDWTPIMTRVLADEIRAAGGVAYIIQEEDGDNDPNFSVGRGLQNAARLCVDLDRAVGGVDAYISMHYEGGPAGGFFGIYPDARSGLDAGTNNPLDKRLIRSIANHVAKTGMPKRVAGCVEPGLMSERQTGVGAQGYRLGEFVGTLGFRDRVARVILEAGNRGTPADYNRISNPTWRTAYAKAIVAGLEETFGAFTGDKTPAPAPKPTPNKPVPGYAVAKPIPGLANRPMLFLDNGATLVRADAIVRTKRATKRLAAAWSGSPESGPMIPNDEEFSIDYIIINADQSIYVYTPWATRVDFRDLELVREDA